MVGADGLGVEPFEVDRLLIGVAETYDVIVRVPADGSYELRATAHDASGYTSITGREPVVLLRNLNEKRGDRSWRPTTTQEATDAFSS